MIVDSSFAYMFQVEVTNHPLKEVTLHIDYRKIERGIINKTDTRPTQCGNCYMDFKTFIVDTKRLQVLSLTGFKSPKWHNCSYIYISSCHKKERGDFNVVTSINYGLVSFINLFKELLNWPCTMSNWLQTYFSQSHNCQFLFIYLDTWRGAKYHLCFFFWLLTIRIGQILASHVTTWHVYVII